MATWSEFETAAPELAATGRELMYRNGDGEAMLVTVRGEAPPRAHPVNAGVIDGHLYTFVQGRSLKRTDLDEDGRYALHTHMDPEAPSEFMIRGHARLIEDQAIRSTVAATWFFSVDDSYPLFELFVEHAVLGERATANDWPPKYTSWAALLTGE